MYYLAGQAHQQEASKSLGTHELTHGRMKLLCYTTWLDICTAYLLADSGTELAQGSKRAVQRAAVHNMCRVVL